MLSNSEIRHEAYTALHGHWTFPVLCTLIYIAVVCAGESMPGVNLLVSILITCPLAYGYTLTMQDVLRGDTSEKILLRPFGVFNDYGRYLGASLLVALYTLLWSLLLIVPGIIKGLSYAMTPFILRDNPDLSISESITRSQNMMEGHKSDLFLLYLSFIGWMLLGFLTAGIGLLWVTPYMQVSVVKFYEELKAGR